jgi:aconitate hydratase
VIEIESTAEMAAKLYATMRQKIEIVRGRLKKPLALADKDLLGHLDAPQTQELESGRSYLALRPDRVVFQDVLGQSGMVMIPSCHTRSL